MKQVGRKLADTVGDHFIAAVGRTNVPVPPAWISMLPMSPMWWSIIVW